MTNIGTQSNRERTGGRDLGLSAIMRVPKGCRVCDEDAPEVAPCPICNRCALPILKLEASRERRDVWTHSRYRRAEMAWENIPAYYLLHDITDKEAGELRGRVTDASAEAWLERYGSRPIEFVNLSTMRTFHWTVRVFVKWIEQRAKEHKAKGCATFEPTVPQLS